MWRKNVCVCVWMGMKNRMAPGKKDVSVICPAQRMTEVKIQSEQQTPVPKI